MSNEYIGRLEGVGLGIETTPGTAVASQAWFRQLKNGFQQKATKLTNESAMGRVEKVNDSATDQTWAEGSIEGKLQDISIGYFLSSVMGAAVTTDNADTNPVVKDHTFDVNQASSPANYLTVAVKNPVVDRRFALGVVDDLEISFKTGEWVTITANVTAKPGAAATNTKVYVDENEFTGRHVTAKLATSVGGLGAAPAVDAMSGKIKIVRKSKPYFPLGSAVPTAVNTEPFEASGELVIRYATTAYEDDWYTNAIKAFQLSFVNTDVTIGAAARPSLVLTGPQTRLNTFDKSDDLDNIVEQTVGFYCELSTSAAYALRAVLTNTQASYVA